MAFVVCTFFLLLLLLYRYLLRHVKKSGMVTPVMPQSNTHKGVDNSMDFWVKTSRNKLILNASSFMYLYSLYVFCTFLVKLQFNPKLDKKD